MKALLFDMDGTLLDSMHAWVTADLDFLKEQGADVEKIDYEVLLTSGTEGAIEYLKDTLELDFDRDVMHAHSLDFMERFYTTEVTTKQGVERMLEAFQEIGIPMAIGSSTPAFLCEMGLDTTEIRHYFDFILSASDTGIPKYEPAFFEEAARRFGVHVDEMAVFDDAMLALRAAREAGALAIGIADEGYGQDEEAVQEESDEFLYSFADFSAEEWSEEHGVRLEEEEEE